MCTHSELHTNTPTLTLKHHRMHQLANTVANARTHTHKLIHMLVSVSLCLTRPQTHPRTTHHTMLPTNTQLTDRDEYEKEICRERETPTNRETNRVYTRETTIKNERERLAQTNEMYDNMARVKVTKKTPQSCTHTPSHTRPK